MSMKCVGGLNHKNKQRPTSYTNNIHSQVPEGEFFGEQSNNGREVFGPPRQSPLFTLITLLLMMDIMASIVKLVY